MQRIVFWLLGLLAQVLGIQADISGGLELGVATLFVWGSVELLRNKVDMFKGLDGIQVHLFAGGVGVVLGIAFGIAAVITGGPFDWIVFGIQATFFATVGDLALKKAGGGQGNSPAPAA